MPAPKKEIMTMKIKILSLLLAGTLLLSLGGCGVFGSDKEKGTSEDENTLTVWCWEEASYIRSMEKAESMYQQEHPEIQLEIMEYSWQQIQEKLEQAAEEGDVRALPDILLVKDAYLMDSEREISLEELFAALDGSGIDFSQFEPKKVQQSQEDGKQYGLPFDLGTVVMAMRTDLLDKAGYTVDDFTDITWEKFSEQGKIVKEKTGSAMLTMVRGQELQRMVPEDIYQEMKASGIVIEVESEDQYISAISGEEAAAVMDSCHIFGEIMAGSIAEGNWAVTNIPAEEGQLHYATTSGCSWVVTKNCEKQQKAFDFLKMTFGNNVEFYEGLMKDLGLMGSYLPVRETEEYRYPQKYFSNQTLYILLTDFDEKARQNGQ